jgi:ribosomal protein S8E
MEQRKHGARRYKTSRQQMGTCGKNFKGKTLKLKTANVTTAD